MAACGYGPAPDGTYDTPPLAAQGDQAWRTASTYAAIAVLAALAWRGEPDRRAPAHAHATARPIHRRLGPRVLGLDDRVAPDDLPLLGHSLPPGSPPHPDGGRRPAGGGAHPRLPRSPRLHPDARDARGRGGGRRRSPTRRSPTPAIAPATTARSGGRSSGWPRSTTPRTLYRLGQGAGLPWGVIRSPEEVLDDRHLAAPGPLRRRRSSRSRPHRHLSRCTLRGPRLPLGHAPSVHRESASIRPRSVRSGPCRDERGAAMKAGPR